MIRDQKCHGKPRLGVIYGVDVEQKYPGRIGKGVAHFKSVERRS